ncbi:MAG: tetratricopeptide repeat protein [Candidatus Thermoplasmatota archaeon]|nr:tetratricopeptide repeat protein [Candidatus Thermoplasmatota archaeon]
MVFDKFKIWRNAEPEGVICPSCQHRNQMGTSVCIRCYYQIDLPSFKQDSGMDEEKSSDLLDELVKEIEQEENGQEEILPPSFSMDDVVVEVEQYGDNEQVTLSQQPEFGAIFNHTQALEEEDNYELTADDVPMFVKKFDMPEPSEETEEIGEPESHPIELVQPTADTPNFVETVSANEVPDTNGWPKLSTSTPTLDPADFDGDGMVDEYEAAFADDNSDSETVVDAYETPVQTPIHKDQILDLPSSPSAPPIPKLSANPVIESSKPHKLEDPPQHLPQAPEQPWKLTHDHPTPGISDKPSFWPWHQQEEWPSTEIKKQLKASIQAASEGKIAESTVLLDEVGPHLGNRTSLVYSVGRLLIAIGRNREAQRMIDSAVETYPNDPEIARAREKLIS